MRSVFSSALVLLLVLVTSDARAHRHDLVDMRVVDRDSGAVLPITHGPGGTYVVGEPGHRYSVRLTNRSAGRVLTVLSVDGVNAVSGETATPDQAGYVLGAYETAEINGWRKSLDEVAQFVFSAPEDSYAQRTGRPHNVGVIGIAIYREALIQPRPEPWSERRYELPRERDQAARADSAGAASAKSVPRQRDALASEQNSELGTGHGAREWSPLATTTFRRAGSAPDQIVELQYDTARHLAERGVIPSPRSQRRHPPRAFAGGFVPDPAY